jgi:Luciferase
MSVKGASVMIDNTMMQCSNVISGTHRCGCKEYRLSKREIRHIHGDHHVDIAFLIKVRNEIIKMGEAEVHNILPESRWVSGFLNCGDDYRAIRVLKKSYELAVTRKLGSYFK